MIDQNAVIGLMIPFAGTTAGAAAVMFMRKELDDRVQRALTGFAAGVMTAASVWSLILPAIEQSSHLGRLSFLPAAAGFWGGVLLRSSIVYTIMPSCSASSWSSSPAKRTCHRKFS